MLAPHQKLTCRRAVMFPAHVCCILVSRLDHECETRKGSVQVRWQPRPPPSACSEGLKNRQLPGEGQTATCFSYFTLSPPPLFAARFQHTFHNGLSTSMHVHDRSILIPQIHLTPVFLASAAERHASHIYAMIRLRRLKGGNMMRMTQRMFRTADRETRCKTGSV